MTGAVMTIYTHSFVLWPDRWQGSSLAVELTWNTVPFDPTATEQVAQLPGVYAFLIRPQNTCNLAFSYLMYVGMTERTLRERFGEYLHEKDSDKIRPKLLRVLPLYPGHLF